MQSHYEITVSKNGIHYFTTSEHSALITEKAEELAKDFLNRFPKSEGFEINVSYEQHTGYCHFNTELTTTNVSKIIKSLSKD